MSAPMTRTVRRTAVVVAALFGALLINLNLLQTVRADQLNARADNARVLIREYDTQRGPILVGEQAVASSVETDGRYRYLRVYSNGPTYAPATGFYSIVYGATGIERAENAVLSGNDDRLFSQRVGDVLAGRDKQGGSVALTLDAAAQAAAFDGLRGQAGAVVALDPNTGAILAMATSPSYDPNLLTSHDPAGIRATYERLQADPADPLLNRAIARTYPPGSTFKIVDAAAALSSGQYTLETEIPAPATLDLPGTTATISNLNGKPCGDGSVTLNEAMRISCNTAFANVGLTLGDDILRDQAERFGFNASFEIPLQAATSVFPEDLTQAQTAQAAIGQFDVRATALQMAQVTAGIANQGRVMLPYLVRELRGPDLAVLERTEPQEFGQAVTPQVALQVGVMMVDVVENGTGKPVAIPGVKVAGKTGTAQTSPGRPPHAWFVAYAPAEAPQVAVAVVVEFGGDAGSEATGGKVAAPIAKAVIEAVLRSGATG